MNLSDLVGSSKGVPFYSAEMADGVNTIPLVTSNGQYNYAQDRSMSVYVGYGASSILDTVIPLANNGYGYMEVIEVDGLLYIHQRNDGGFCKYDIENNSWTLLADPPISFYSGELIEKDGFIYCLGYYDHTNGAWVNDAPLKYDITNDSWTTLSAPSGTLPGANVFRVFNTGTEILVVAQGDTELFSYSIADNEYTSKATGFPKLNAQQIYYNGYIYYIQNDSRRLYRVSVNGGESELLSATPGIASNDVYHGMFVYNEIIYFLGSYYHKYMAYNISTKITQEAVLGLTYCGAANSTTNSTIVSGNHMYVINPYNSFGKSNNGNIMKTDLTKPHFYNIKV